MADARFGWLVSYPKSGNTWMRMMLASLLAGGGEIDINHVVDDCSVATRAEMDELLGVESSELTHDEIAEARPALHAEILAFARGPLVLRKVHDRFWRTASGTPAFDVKVTRGAVYLVRDPRDVAVSYAHHRGLPVNSIIQAMSDPAAELARFELACKRQLPQPLGTWSGHITSWLEQSEMPVLVLRYEDLKKDPRTGLRAAAALFGIPATESQIESAVQATRFEVLRAQEESAGFRERRREATSPFFRRGVVGDWRSALSRSQQDRIIEEHREMMERFQYLS